MPEFKTRREAEVRIAVIKGEIRKRWSASGHNTAALAPVDHLEAEAARIRALLPTLPEDDNGA